MLNIAPLLNDASIRDFQRGKVGYVANLVEQVLLLPKDMADLKSMRKHEVFLSLKRDLAMVSHLIPPPPFFLFFSFIIFLFFIAFFSSFVKCFSHC